MSDETPRYLIIPEENYYYTQTHEWVFMDDKNSVTIGITYYAQDSLGELVSWKLPQKGQFFEKGQAFGWVESNKSVNDLYMPVSGEIVEINNSLTPSLLSDEPMSEGWLVRIEMYKEGEIQSLLNPQAYRKLLEKKLADIE